MRILFIHNRYKYKGGEDVVVDAEARLLKKYNNKVEVLLFDNKEIIGIKNKIKYGIYSFYNPQSLKIIKDKVLKFDPDIIHIHNFFPLISPSVFWGVQKINKPIIMTLHNYRFVCPNAMLTRGGEVCEKCIKLSYPFYGIRYSCYRNSMIQTFMVSTMIWVHDKIKTWRNKIDKYIVLTDFAKNIFQQSTIGIPSEKLIVKPNFVEDNGFNFKKENFFLYVGRLSEEKGIDVLLESFKKTKKRLHIIGEGPLDYIIEDMICENIIYHGFKDHEFIIQKMKKAKALIFTSKLYEGMPMVILEAFSTGTPVICGNLGGPAEMIKDGVNGFLYEAGNERALSERVLETLHDPEKAFDMSVMARKEYEKFYTADINYQKLSKIYSDVIEYKKKGSK